MKNKKPSARELLCCFCVGGIFSAFELIGKVMSDAMNALNWRSNIVYFVLVALGMGAGIYLFYNFLDYMQCNKNDDKNSSWSMKKIFLVVFMCWLPYCLLSYPARFGGGSHFQLKQYLGMETNARIYSSIVYDGYYITNHHPVFLTYLYGFFYDIGEWMGNVNRGMFLLSILILLLSAVSMTYALVSLRRYVSQKVFRFVLVFVCMYPVYGIYSYTICKDNLFASALLVFSTCLLEIYYSKGKCLEGKFFSKGFMTICVVVPFLKHQGLIIVLVSLLSIVFVAGTFGRKILWNAGVVIVVYSVLFTNIFMPVMKIAPGGRQEALSIPFQQTAYCVKHYGEEMSEEERAVINEILPVEEIGYLYEEERADAVKFTFRQDTTSAELVDYFYVWLKQFLKYPIGYAKAFFEMNYGYYYLGFKDGIFDLYQSVDVGGISTPNWTQELFVRAEQLWEFMCNLTGIGVLFRTAVMTWLMFVSLFYCIYKKRYRRIIVLTPVILSFAVCLLSPWNGVYRYELPIICAFPIMSCVLSANEEHEGRCRI
ncbi:MAG: hypothetical protein IJC02_13870 [Lachnospiraceae bacterium]|nr:hypothetical protein [Lachnospiraceae bacterium]